MKQTLIHVLLMLLYSSVTAQHITLSGRVADSQSAEPIPFANVALYTKTDTLFVRGNTTDSQGQFTIKGGNC